MSRAENENRSREEELQEAFDEAAAGLDLELVAPEAESRYAGAVVVQPTARIHVPRPRPAPRISNRDEIAIERLVKTWETVPYDDILQTWLRHCAHPVGVFLLEGIGIVTEEEIRAGVKSKAFQKKLKDYPPYSPRRVEISALRTVFIARTQAFAIYHLQEEFRNGKIFAGNSAMMMLKDEDDRWKIAAYSQHIPNRDLQPVE